LKEAGAQQSHSDTQSATFVPIASVAYSYDSYEAIGLTTELELSWLLSELEFISRC